jgi:hypothetical protein
MPNRQCGSIVLYELSLSPSTHDVVLGVTAPAFVKSNLALYIGGSIWQIDLMSPAGPRLPTGDSKTHRRPKVEEGRYGC